LVPDVHPNPQGADEKSMRRTPVASLLVLTAGLTASAVLRRLIERRRSASAAAAVSSSASATSASVPVPTAAVARDAVVLPFTPRVVAAPVAQRSAGAARCGDSGGQTKAGAPCAARATTGARCHHHRLAA